MADLNEYLNKRGITAKQMDVAREQTQAVIDAYNLREARKASNLTQVELAQAMGVSQNRVSRMENGDINAMSVDALRRYVEALGGHMTLMADLPTGRISIA
jgi:predicted XRE-type DNA-binding protein